MRPDFHPESLLWAVERWQKGGDSAAKRTRGARLKKEVLSSLPDSLFRRCTGTVFRRLALNQSSIWTFVTTGSLPETISAWTLDIEIAKGVKGGVPEEWKSGKRWFGLFCRINQAPTKSSSTWKRCGSICSTNARSSIVGRIVSRRVYSGMKIPNAKLSWRSRRSH